jgi:hypothetical protein
MTERDDQLFSGSSGFFRYDDRATVVVAAVRASPVLQFLLMAVGALRCRRGHCLVMRAAFTPAGL